MRSVLATALLLALSTLRPYTSCTDGDVQCGDSDMMERMMMGGDVCCDYTDGRSCGTFPIEGLQNVVEECADTGVVDTSESAQHNIRMPWNRDCNRWVTGLRFPGIILPPSAVIEEAYVLFPVVSPATQSSAVSLQISVEATDNALPLNQEAQSISGRFSTNSVVVWTPDTWQPSGSSPVQMSANIGTLIATLTSRPGWQPGNAILVKIEPGPNHNHQGTRVAGRWDDNRQLPAIRIVYHTDDSIKNSMQAYHVQMTEVAKEEARAKADSWSNGQIFLLMVFVALCVAAAMRQYQRKFGRREGNKYDKVQTDEEARGLTGDDDFGEFDSEGPSVERDAKGNPVARAYLSEGTRQSQSNFVYRDSSGNVR